LLTSFTAVTEPITPGQSITTKVTVNIPASLAVGQTTYCRQNPLIRNAFEIILKSGNIAAYADLPVVHNSLYPKPSVTYSSKKEYAKCLGNWFVGERSRVGPISVYYNNAKKSSAVSYSVFPFPEEQFDRSKFKLAPYWTSHSYMKQQLQEFPVINTDPDEYKNHVDRDPAHIQTLITTFATVNIKEEALSEFNPNLFQGIIQRRNDVLMGSMMDAVSARTGVNALEDDIPAAKFQVFLPGSLKMTAPASACYAQPVGDLAALMSSASAPAQLNPAML